MYSKIEFLPNIEFYLTHIHPFDEIILKITKRIKTSLPDEILYIIGEYAFVGELNSLLISQFDIKNGINVSYAKVFEKYYYEHSPPCDSYDGLKLQCRYNSLILVLLEYIPKGYHFE